MSTVRTETLYTELVRIRYYRHVVDILLADMCAEFSRQSESGTSFSAELEQMLEVYSLSLTKPDLQARVRN
ncbi:hypothetical protein CC2G_011081 [Coprinopsis cinerea AmutBmut pab1-1]|nr:hypothetical protein CC2G_011072 [Coprinopsis cinerea AmutBmut pab1-1]KAG2014246.1 hypothetical protein CC2G_011081 [Coprinopsis cinerea AmutBmut pab1-1]